MSEPRINISSRVDPKTLATAALFLEKQGWAVETKSDLVEACFKMIAVLSQGVGEFSIPDQYEDAFDILSRFGIEWKGKRAEREKLHALQYDTLSGLDQEDLDKVRTLLTDLRNRKKRIKKKSDLLKELEAIDANE
ncbi:hypothetical protein LCGC14_3107090 [marine sediment metagenome]|uniref:Uncharacterized protein n=1 Tax=marine sediment metagenome TaxID=412755 RepID=A0A0F8W697_9ZZZZ